MRNLKYWLKLFKVLLRIFIFLQFQLARCTFFPAILNNFDSISMVFSYDILRTILIIFRQLVILDDFYEFDKPVDYFDSF